MKEIKLTQGKVALVDDEDYEYLNQWNWYASKRSNGSFIAIRTVNKKKVLMHRVIMNTPENLIVDHIDHNSLNNQKSNLRNCTHSQNAQNMKLYCEGIFHKGISWDKVNEKWKAYIRVNGKLIHLGRFKDEENAARAYNTAATKYFGEFAYLNQIGGVK